MEDLTQETLSETFWKEPVRAETILKELKENQKWVARFTAAQNAIEELEIGLELLKEGAFTETELDAAYADTSALVEEMEFKRTITKEEDSLNAILEINAGAGGTEACDWAGMLL
ncbi:MAG TPA: PCRF domain-containing protein, partial [Saprospiraceae bacterium]|nr:PCRF domain-containing protein [Saprospiraceae bacterium]